MSDLSRLVPELGILVVVLGFLYKMALVFKGITDDFSRALDRNTAASREVAEATKQAAREAAERNGHLAELAIENHRASMKALKHLSTQNVNEQHVSKQVIERRSK